MYKNIITDPSIKNAMDDGANISLPESSSPKHNHFIDEPARQVNLDFVFASASGFGFSFEVIRTSQIRMTPSDDAEAIKLDVSEF